MEMVKDVYYGNTLRKSYSKHGDIIELGKTKLMFVPFSSDAFDWDWTQE